MASLPWPEDLHKTTLGNITQPPLPFSCCRLSNLPMETDDLLVYSSRLIATVIQAGINAQNFNDFLRDRLIIARAHHPKSRRQGSLG